MTAAELLVGVALAEGARRRSRQAFVEAVLASVTLEDYDLAVARQHATLLVHVRRTGRPCGAHDLMIAATAVARSRVVITSDSGGFADLPGVTVHG